MRKAVSYLRCASRDQAEVSIQCQRDAISEYCAANDIELADEYIDVGCSSNDIDRPAFQQLMSDAQEVPVWGTVIVYDCSRFSRRMIDYMQCEDLLSGLGIELACVAQQPEDVNVGVLLRVVEKLQCGKEV